MQSFEHVCKVALEAEGLVVTSNVKFPVQRETRKKAYKEVQTTVYEIDLVGARCDRLILVEVKSYFGSRGIGTHCFAALAKKPHKRFQRFKIFNDHELREQICRQAAEKYGYKLEQVELRLYAGNILQKDRELVERYLKSLGVTIVDLQHVTKTLLKLAQSSSYTDDPVVMTVKALAAAGTLKGLPEIPLDESELEDDDG